MERRYNDIDGEEDGVEIELASSSKKQLELVSRDQEAIAKPFSQVLPEDQRNHAYVRFLYLPVAVVVAACVAVPLARMSFRSSDESRWWAGFYWFILIMHTGLIVMLPYRQAFYDDRGKPIMSFSLAFQYYLVVTTPNALLAFLRFAWAPKDIVADTEDAQPLYHIMDTLFWSCILISFFAIMPYLHYRHFHQYYLTHPEMHTYNNGKYVRENKDDDKEESVVDSVLNLRAALDLKACGGNGDTNRERPTTVSYMSYFVVLAVASTLGVIITQRHDLLNLSSIGVLIIVLWGVTLVLDRNFDSNAGHARRPDPAYLVMVSFACIMLPLIGSRLFWDALDAAHGAPAQQVLVVFLWNMFMITFNIMLRRTIRIAYRVRQGTAFAFVFAIQFFDDAFVSLAFLELETFNVTYFLLVVWHMINDYARDVGLRSDIWHVILTIFDEPPDLQERIATLCEQLRVTDQNVTSEVMAIVIVPLVLGLDKAWNVGVDSVSCGTGDSVKILLGYLVLFCLEICNHACVHGTLHWKRNRLQQEALAADGSVRPPLKRETYVGDSRDATRRGSLMHQFWNLEVTMLRHWHRQLTFFAVTVSAALFHGIWTVSQFRHEATCV